MKKRVAVVGAGLSGLVTVKELLAAGHQPVCMEKAESLGGVFRFGEDDGVVWESCQLTSSGYLTAFSDFPVTKERAEHMHSSEYIRYLEDYCREFGVLQHVRFSITVLSIRQVEGGSWQVTSTGAGGETEEYFDAVAVCSGLHQHPHHPAYEGQDSFPGEVLHAAHYRRPGQVKGKKVLIVGAGESGADIAAEVARHADEAVLSLRRGVAVVPRCAFGKPRDYLTSRLMNAPAHWMGQTRNPKDNHRRKVYRTLGFPLLVIEKFLFLLYRYGWETLPLYFSTSLTEIKAKLQTRDLTTQILKESGGTLFEQFGTKDDGFIHALAAGTLKRVSGICHFEGQSVQFTDGSCFQPDIVLFCTGFETKTPFLDEETGSAPRYLNTFNPDVGAGLGFIGFVRPAFGAIPPLAELQARWFARLLSRELELPSAEEMKQSVETSEEKRHHVFSAKDDRLTHLVDHTEFCDLLADQAGCKPRLEDLEKESRAFRKRFWSGPFIAAQYRLAGPGAKPELARQIVESMPLAHPWPQRFHLYLRWSVCRILHRLLGPEYAPKLSVR